MKEFWKWCLAGGLAGAVYIAFNIDTSTDYHLSIFPEDFWIIVGGQLVGGLIMGGVFGAIAFRIYKWRRKKPYE